MSESRSERTGSANGGKATSGRLPLPQIEPEVGLADGWLRFWQRGELISLTAEMATQLEVAEAELARLRGLLPPA